MITTKKNECYCMPNDECLFNFGLDWRKCMFVILDDHPEWDKKVCPFFNKEVEQK